MGLLSRRERGRFLLCFAQNYIFQLILNTKSDFAASILEMQRYENAKIAFKNVLFSL